MKNKEALDNLNKAMLSYRKTASYLYDKHSETEFNRNFASWDSDTFYAFRSLFLFWLPGNRTSMNSMTDLRRPIPLTVIDL
jgi:hypothetical protein